ncbi:CapA family protein [Paenibacillus ferrarius]|uniref:CapA family protein n=1 Tax=Paenibacillus ferrarius TaxID=1469647 RepID=UPI003D2BA610
MESRRERHTKPKKNRTTGKQLPWRTVGGLTVAAVLCFAVGMGASYLTSKGNAVVDSESAASPITSASPLPTVSGTSTPAASSQPSPSSSSTPIGTNPPMVGVTPSATTGTVLSESGAAGQVKLSFVGDVMFASKVEDIVKQKGYDYPFTNVKEDLKKPDYTIANLETPISTRGTPQDKEYSYRSAPEALTALKNAGIDLVNLANNHVMDYGEAAFLDTMASLDETGIRRVGAGKDAAEAYQPVIVEKQGVRIAFLGFSRVVPNTSWKAGKNHPGVAETYDYRVPVEAIQKAKANADLVVVIAHWGIEREDAPDKYQKELAHRYIDAGADLIVGGHPHVLQGFEQYKGKWIAYSLGNFVFTTNENQKTWDSAILEASCSKAGGCNLHVAPILTTYALPTPMGPEDGAKLFARLSQISIGAKVDGNGYVSLK